MSPVYCVGYAVKGSACLMGTKRVRGAVGRRGRGRTEVVREENGGDGAGVEIHRGGGGQGSEEGEDEELHGCQGC
jgi:hypothetical protein